MSEIWKAIPNWEGMYEVSDQGRVKSLARAVTKGSGSRKICTRILSLSVKKTGYVQVNLSRNGRDHLFHVHRLVTLAFIGPCPEGQEVRHLDTDRTNNRLDNLTYGTASENYYDFVKAGRKRKIA